MKKRLLTLCVEVILSSFGPDASLIGAIAIVVDDVLSNPISIERRWSRDAALHFRST